MDKPYTTIERAIMRASFLSPETTFHDWLRSKVPDNKARRAILERINKGIRGMHGYELISEIFSVPVVFWLDESRSAVMAMARRPSQHRLKRREKPYTLMERAIMRASFLSPETTFHDWLRSKVPDGKEHRVIRERLKKGDLMDARVMHIIERVVESLNEIFNVHTMFWLENNCGSVKRMAKGEVMAAYVEVESRTASDVLS